MSATTNATHTPGPWTIEESAHQQEFSHWVGTTSPRVLPRQSTIAAVVNAGKEESAANACLIAAAPELLAVCRRFLEMYDDVRDSVGPSVRATLEQADRVVAKAEGGAR